MNGEPNAQDKPVNDDVLDAEQAAWLIGAHVETLRRMARRGALPTYKVGKDWRFSKAALQQWMSKRPVLNRQRLALVVDDERDMLNMMFLFLSKAGYRVELADSGQKAVAAAQRAMPDIVLLDLVMPGMSGVDVLRQLRAMAPNVPVIVMTGYPDSELMSQALCYAPITLLPKPVDRQILIRTVQCAIGRATS